MSLAQMLALQFKVGGLVRVLDGYSGSGQPIPPAVATALQLALADVEKALKAAVELAE